MEQLDLFTSSSWMSCPVCGTLYIDVDALYCTECGYTYFPSSVR